LAQLQSFAVNRPGVEAIKQSLYDHLLYVAAGQTQLNFFTNPIGQGVTTAPGASVGAAKTIADTNMELAGQLPAGKSFLIEGIEVTFYSGLSSTASTYSLATPAIFNATAAAAVAAQVSDVNAFYQSGSLRLFIGSKDYLSESPLMRFPPMCRLDVDAAIASNSATTAEVGIATARAVGRPFQVQPPIKLTATQNFKVILEWPGVLAMPSTFNGRVGVILDGLTYRNSQ